MAKNKKILLLLAGGTALDDKNINSSSVSKPQDVDKWFEQISEATLLGEIQPVFICPSSSALPEIAFWRQLCGIIKEKYDEAHGFVITVDLNSILNCGIGLSFALRNLNKTVVLVSSQISPETIGSPEWQNRQLRAYGGLGLKANLINAVQLAQLGYGSVALMFGNKIIKPIKAVRRQAVGLSIFENLDPQSVGAIDFGISLSVKPKTSLGNLTIQDNFCENIDVVEYSPQFNAAQLAKRKIKGLVIKNLPSLAMLAGLKTDLPVLVYNPFLAGQQSPAENILVVSNLTWETSVIKFSWALGQKGDWRKIMADEYCGEFS